jgi:hypothetical protein
MRGWFTPRAEGPSPAKDQRFGGKEDSACLQQMPINCHETTRHGSLGKLGDSDSKVRPEEPLVEGAKKWKFEE